MQYVKCDLGGTAYTYSWSGDEPLKRGDWVVLPANRFNQNPFYAVVVRTLEEPDFDGKISAILERVDLL